MIALEDLDLDVVADEKFEWERDEGWEDLYEDVTPQKRLKTYSAIVRESCLED